MSKFLRNFEDESLNEGKANYKDTFELTYLRHRYFRKSTNPDPKRLMQFEEMICNISDKIYFRQIDIFKSIGMEVDDLRNISRVHTVSFFSMSGLQENPAKMKSFIERHKKKMGQQSEPTERDIFLKEAYDLAKFLNQRVQEVANICKSKLTNVRGTKSARFFFIGEPEQDPDDTLLAQDPGKYGYKKITGAHFQRMLKETKPKNRYKFINKEGKQVRAVYLQGSILTEKDIEHTCLDYRDTFFYRNPEDNLILQEHYDTIG